MGDTGSLILGTVMSIIVIKFNELNVDQSAQYSIASAPAVSFAILIYPLADTLRVFIIRALQRKSPFSPDKNHTHHRLLTLGFSHKEATYTIIAINAVFVIPVFLLQNLGIAWLMLFNIMFSLLLFTIPGILIQRRHLIKDGDPHQQILFPRPAKKILNQLSYISNEPKSKTKVINLNKFHTQVQKLNFW